MKHIRIWRYKSTGKVTKGTLLKLACCLLKADKDTGSPLLRGIARKLTGINLDAPKRIITARRINI